MYCQSCGTKILENAKFCGNCGASLKSPDTNNDSDISRELKLEAVKLAENDLPPPEERTKWTEGVFIGKEGGKFCVDLPREYRYNQDIRLQGTNSFGIQTKQFHFTLVGDEISNVFQVPENLTHFKDSIKIYLDSVMKSLKAAGIELSEKDFKQYVVETGGSWWCRTTYWYKMSPDLFWKMSGYNLFGKSLAKLIAGKSFKKAGYKKGAPYEEYKVVDFFNPKAGSNRPVFALCYTFDAISGGDTKEMLKTINAISSSLDYYDGK